MNNLYNYVFWCNSYTNLWYAIPRDKQVIFFSGEVNQNKIAGVFSNKNIIKLIDKLNKK